MHVRHRAGPVVLMVLLALVPACTGSKKKNDAKPGPGASSSSSPGTSASPTPSLDPGKPEDVAHRYLELWQAGDFAGAALLTDADPVEVQESHDATSKGLKATTITITPGTVDVTGDTATAAFTVKYDLPGLGDWSYENQLPLAKLQDKWVVKWTPAVVYPTLLAGQRLARTRSLPPRADILDAAGKPLFTKKARITVGIEPRRLKADPTPMYAVLGSITKVDIAVLKAKVAAAKPDQFVPVVTYTAAQFAPLDARLRPLPGVIFHKDAQISSAADTFARAVLGRVGEATAEVLDAAGGQYQAGDQLGLSGLQSAFQSRLTGTPLGEIVIKTGTSTVESVKEFAGEAPKPVKTTLDSAIQIAAEKALGNSDKPAALVAIRASTGAILAVANRPENNAFNRAFVGRYPPGSTMKVITSAALLKTGLKLTDPVACPVKQLVLGKTFRNFEGEERGTVPFAKDFADSCNTAFVSLVDRLAPTSMSGMATAFGIGRDWKLPLPAFSGQVPVAKDQTELAASMIGQGRVLASPLDMALVAAAIASGTWRSPVLVTDPAPEQPQQTTPVDPAALASIRQLMRLVVTEGTGKSLVSVPGAPISGKTGTAEFGSGTPLPTHAWFIGFRGDIAIAVIVEGGGVGGRVAAPIVGAFFKQIP